LKVCEQVVKTDLPADYGSQIRRLRVSVGLTQMAFANLMGVSFASINRWENGQARPSALAWQKIVRAEQWGIEAIEDGFVPSAEQITVSSRKDDELEEPCLDFSSNPEAVRAVAEAERLSYGHLFNPAFATEISLIDPLPHQRLAVYGYMLRQPQLRFLLADDAGAGKTIMAGLYIREMLTRRLIRRVLIIPPAGLVGNWERELRTLFSLSFRVVSGSEARSNNPFLEPASDLLIVSIDTLAGERMFARLQESSVAPYDLVVFDEAHKLSANREPDFTMRKTDRYRLAEALAGLDSGDPRWRLPWQCHHVLLLTATPHMGKDFPYYCLWRLLEPEVLSTFDAFGAYPFDARQRHFLRRTKEEMVRFDGSAIYPTRVSDTLSYDLTPGDRSEQGLYEETTSYIRTYYNRARILNRSAAHLAMSVFQRRLASSTYAVLRSFERRREKLERLIEDVQSGRLSLEHLQVRQHQLDALRDVFEEETADEERSIDGVEENETSEERALGGVVAVSLAELAAERLQVQRLCDLARQVYDAGEEAKFEKLRDILRDPQYGHEKLIIFTEHRDTLDFLVRRLEGLGFTGQVARIHGGMDYRERDEQVEVFRKSVQDGSAKYLVATDAAGEGINLQFCWLMINYDIPWNPARLEQRMGRIHRYGQRHDPVIILNLVAGKTREGRVLKTLLEKLERIRKELGSDKVFDVIGRLFEGVSLKEYMAQAVTEEGADTVQRRIEGTLTAEQVQALATREQRLFGDGGDIQRELPRLQADMEGETYRRLLPGYVRRFIEKAAPLVDVEIEGNLDGFFSFRPHKPTALDPLWPVLETYVPEQRERLTVQRPRDSKEAIWLHPGEPCFERFRQYVCGRFARDALKGAVFIDPTTARPYLFHLAFLTVIRQADPTLAPFARPEVLEYRLLGLKQEETGPIQLCPVEQLLVLKGGGSLPATVSRFAAMAEQLREQARVYGVEQVARPLVEQHRQRLVETLPERAAFLRRGYDYQDAELASARARLAEKARTEDPRAKAELTRIKERQRKLATQREHALAIIRREPTLLMPGEVTFLAHALVVPSNDPEDRKRHDAEIEAIAMRVAWAYEEAGGALVIDVSTPDQARTAGLIDYPGFDLLSKHPAKGERNIEVKGRAAIGEVELSENEWVKACNLRERYWLYVVYNCASSRPRLLRVQDPFASLLVRARGGVIIHEQDVFAAAEAEP
jgi:superfamily II DNA or RNA helicase/DNA-binding XRE family transcriptional regulator